MLKFRHKFFSLLYKHSKRHFSWDIYGMKANSPHSKMLDNYRLSLNKKILELHDLRKSTLDENVILPKKIERFYDLEQHFFYGKLGLNLYALAIDHLNHDKINFEIKKVIDSIANKDWETLLSCIESSNSDYEFFLKPSLLETTFKALQGMQKYYISVDVEALKKDIAYKNECSKNSGYPINDYVP